MTAETSLNLPGIFCATVVTVFTSVPSEATLVFSARRCPKMGNPALIPGTTITQFGGLRKQQTS